MSDDFTTLYPFSSNYLNIDGHQYHYLDEGEGPVVVMLHGNPTWSFYYRNLILGLRDKHRVIVPDHMGCGLSDKPQDYAYCLAQHVRNLNTLLEHLEVEEMCLVVHDWGGPIGLGYAVEHATSIKRMLVFNTTCAISMDYPKRILLCKIPLLGPFLIRGCNFFAGGASLLGSRVPGKMTKAVRDGYLRPYRSYADRIANLRFVQDIPLSAKHPTWDYGRQIEDQLDKLAAVPKYICWGDKDFCFIESFLNDWCRRYPDATVKRFPYAGHYVVEDAIDEILPIAQDFLNLERAPEPASAD